VLAASLPFPVEDEGEVPPVNPADSRFDENLQQIVQEVDPIRAEAADRMPTYATQALTVDFAQKS